MAESEQPQSADFSKVGHFNLVYMRTGVAVDVLEIPLSLIQEDGAVVSHTTMAMAAPHGENYTIVPVDNIDVLVMRDVYTALQQMDKPNRLFSVLQDRCDGLTRAVENMFGFNTYKVIDSAAAAADLMLFHAGKNKRHEPKLVRRPRIGTMYEKVVPQLPVETEE